MKSKNQNKSLTNNLENPNPLNKDQDEQTLFDLIMGSLDQEENETEKADDKILNAFNNLKSFSYSNESKLEYNSIREEDEIDEEENNNQNPTLNKKSKLIQEELLGWFTGMKDLDAFFIVSFLK